MERGKQLGLFFYKENKNDPAFMDIVLIDDDYDDVLEEANLWIHQERNTYGKDNLPEYTWDLFDTIKMRNLKLD